MRFYYLLQRQDLFSYGLSYLMRDNLDQVHFKISLSKEDMDTYVFCIANKRTAARVSKEMTDLVSNDYFKPVFRERS